MTRDPLDQLGERLFEAARREPLPAGAADRLVVSAWKQRRARAASARRFRAGRFGAAVLLAAMLVSVALLLRREEPAVSIGAEPGVPRAIEHAAPPPPERAPAAVVPPEAPSRAPSAASSSRARPAPPPTLADELAALKRAESALAASNPAEALVALDRYDHVLGGKQMRAEAMLLRMEALSRAGKPDAASALATRFVRDNPQSPLVDRARSFLKTAPASRARPEAP